MSLWWIAVPALLPLGVTLFNLVFWPRGRDIPPPRMPSVSVLIPARDEASTIEACVRGAAALDPTEIVVYDDGSTDETPQILARLAEELPALRVVRGVPLPEDWVGKPHACHQLSELAAGELLLYVDADVNLDPSALRRLVDLKTELGANAITAVPRQRTVGAFERMMLPLLHLTYTSWLPLPLIWKSSNPRFLAANGQILLIEREAYDAIGGHTAVQHEVVEDMALCRALKLAGQRVVFADGHHMATCRMYESPRGVWEGFSKNLYEGLGSPLLLGAVFAVHILCFLLPYLALAASLVWPALLLPALLGVGLNMALRLAAAVRYRQPLEGVLLHPIAITVLLALAINSLRWVLKGQIRWAGRTYASRSARGGSA